MAWIVETLDARVDREINALPKDLQAALLRLLELIEEFGLEGVGYPDVRPVEGKLWELRCRGRSGIARGLYVTQSGKRLVVLVVFQKKTQATPRRYIDLAHERLRKAKT